MNCDKVKEKLDVLVFEQDFAPDEELTEHARTCPGCAAYLDEARKASRILRNLRETEPIPADPDQLTRDILDATGRIQGMPRRLPARHPASSRTLDLVVRVLAAATVCLLLELGIEQVSMVRKVTLLEKQSSEAAREPGYRISPRTLPLADLSAAGLGKSYRVYEGSFVSSFGLLKKRMETLKKP